MVALLGTFLLLSGRKGPVNFTTLSELGPCRSTLKGLAIVVVKYSNELRTLALRSSIKGNESSFEQAP